MQLIFSLAMIK